MIKKIIQNSYDDGNDYHQLRKIENLKNHDEMNNEDQTSMSGMHAFYT